MTTLNFDDDIYVYIFVSCFTDRQFIYQCAIKVHLLKILKFVGSGEWRSAVAVVNAIL